MTAAEKFHHPLYSLVLEAARLRVEIDKAKVAQTNAERAARAAQTRAHSAADAVTGPSFRLQQTEEIIDKLAKRDRIEPEVLTRWMVEAREEAEKA